METHGLDVEEIQRQLETQVLGVGDRLLYFPVTTSTNSLAMQLAHERPAEGVVILTDSQTAGKGRQGRRWLDTPGCNVLSSTLLQPRFPAYFLVMIASLAVVDAIAQTSELVATIKWPNDVLIEEKKVAGVLIETSHDQFGHMVAIMGIGVNINGQINKFIRNDERQLEEVEAAKRLIANATTLETACGHPVSRETFIATLLHHLERTYQTLQQDQLRSTPVHESTSRLLRERWRNHLSTLGRIVEVRQGNSVLSGVAEDVDGHGELLLRSHSGARITVTWGDVGYPTN